MTIHVGTRGAIGLVLQAAFAGRDEDRYSYRRLIGLDTAVNLYAAAVRVGASEALQRSLFQIAISRVELVDMRSHVRTRKGA